tara:strand:- start:43 stop:996 length:954 start_codon:yes stop_codon:yes gene_type:complete
MYNLIKKFFKNEDSFFYGKSQLKDKFFSKLLYCPHPFTNWSLNPHTKYNSEFMHTKEGFRKTSKFNSIIEEFENSNNQCDIYCIGGSTTYCDSIKNYSDTWPYLLKELHTKEKNFFLVNGGVGGWSTIQSLIRFFSWGAVLKPKLTIFYQSKNDLTPLVNGREIEEKIFPLMENVMLQFDTSLKSNFKNYKLNNYGVASVYGKDIFASEKGLKRLTNEWKDLYATRCKMVVELAKSWNGKVVFVPEIFSEKSIYYNALCEMNDVMKAVSQDKKNTLFLDLRNEIEINDKNFIDFCHFTKEGCEKFSNLLYENLKKFL